MTVEIRRITEVSDALEEAFARLMPQLSPRLGAPSREELRRVAGSETGSCWRPWPGNASSGC
ncbi:MAG: hypothetical protein ACLUFW_11010 [Alistipes sp.]